MDVVERRTRERVAGSRVPFRVRSRPWPSGVIFGF